MTHGIALIGLGVMGRRMIARLRQHAGFRITAIWDPSPEAVAVASREAPEAAIAPDPAAIAARADTACVYIASPPASHAELCHRMFDADKTVFCEKPLTRDLAAGERLAARARDGKRSGAVNFSMASSPSFNAVIAAAESGRLGRIERISILAEFARWPRDWQPAGRWLAERVEGGFTREVLSHFVFATQRITGPLTIEGRHVDYPADGVTAETALRASLTGKGIAVEIDAAIRGKAADHNLWTVAGSLGTLRMRDWYGLDRRDGGTWVPAIEGSVDELRFQAGLRQLDQLAALLDGRPHTLPGFDEAFAVQRTIEGLLD